MKVRDALLAKTGESAGNRLARHADDLPDLIMGQGHFDSVGRGHPGIVVRPIQDQAGNSLGAEVITNERRCW